MDFSNKGKWLPAVIGALAFICSPAHADPVQAGTNDALCVTTAIQSAVEKDVTFSDHAHHIVVITTDNHEVFLKGSVANEGERKRVKDVASQFLGANQLRDQLTIAP